VIRRGAVGLVVVAAVVVLVGVPARGYCADYTIDVAPKVVAPGDVVTITGEHWFICDDIGGGCQGRFEDTNDPPVKPGVTVRSRAVVNEVITASAPTRRDGRFVLTYTVPIGVPPGLYAVVAIGNGGTKTATFRVMAS
jgi:hypothetical protein